MTSSVQNAPINTVHPYPLMSIQLNKHYWSLLGRVLLWSGRKASLPLTSSHSLWKAVCIWISPMWSILSSRPVLFLAANVLFSHHTSLILQRHEPPPALPHHVAGGELPSTVLRAWAPPNLRPSCSWPPGHPPLGGPQEPSWDLCSCCWKGSTLPPACDTVD